MFNSVCLSNISDPQGICFVDLDESLVSVFSLGAQAAEHCVDSLVFPFTGLLEIVHVDLLHFQLFAEVVPLGERTPSDNNHFPPPIIAHKLFYK